MEVVTKAYFGQIENSCRSSPCLHSKRYQFSGKFTISLSNKLASFFVQEVGTLPEDHFYEFRLFTGETIKLDHTGDFYIDGERCSGVAFTGVNDC